MPTTRMLITFIMLVLLLLPAACIQPRAQAVDATQPTTASALPPLHTFLSSTSSTVTQTNLASEATLLPATLIPSLETVTPPASPTPALTPTLARKSWRLAPVLPVSVSPRMLELYQLGQALGKDPRAFSKVGDCQTMLPDFFGDFDNGRYNLGEYTYLQPVVDYFAGSFERYSRGVKDGMTASGAMATLWNTWKDCTVEETPLECEYRIHKPSFAIISLGTNDANGLLPFEDTLRRVIDVTLEHGIVPILVTKADNAEGDWSINSTIYRLAYEYEIPVWNFWLAVQPLPLRGLRSPEHLTYGEYTLTCDFSQAENMQYAYNVRNLTGLQVLDVVWRAVSGQPAADFTPAPVPYRP
jgi:hypothetical protein